jgi:hypothetical protein
MALLYFSDLSGSIQDDLLSRACCYCWQDTIACSPLLHIYRNVFAMLCWPVCTKAFEKQGAFALSKSLLALVQVFFALA